MFVVQVFHILHQVQQQQYPAVETPALYGEIFPVPLLHVWEKLQGNSPLPPPDIIVLCHNESVVLKTLMRQDISRPTYNSML